MNRILGNMREAARTGVVRVGEGLRRDVAWFCEFARRFNGLLLIPRNLPELVIECDSTLQSGGGWGAGKYYRVVYPANVQNEHHISRLEALNAVIALKTLVPPGDNLEHVRVHIYSDNSASVAVMMNGRTGDQVMASTARDLAMYVAMNQWEIVVTHKPGKDLVLADALSRYDTGDGYKAIVEKEVSERKLVEVQPVDLIHILYTDF